MRHQLRLALAVAGSAAALAVPASAKAQTVNYPAQSSQYVPPYRYDVPGNPYRGNVVGPSYVGPWYTYAARPLRPRRFFRRGDPTQELGWPTGRGVPLAKP
jgi:hypothetical protein